MSIRFPKIVWIVPTTRCNTRCRTCGHFYSDSGEDMSLEVFAKIEREVLDHVRRVHLVGGGEPLISKIFPAMLEACIQRKIKIFFITNTIALTEEMVRVLVQNDAEIMVSIDGATPETYNSIRPFIRFERLLAKLEMIKNIRAEYPGNQFKLFTNTVVMKRNLPELPQLVALANKYAVDTAIFSDYIPHPTHPDFNDEVPSTYPELIRDYAPQAVALAKEYGLNFEMPAYYQLLASEQGREKSTGCGDCPKQGKIQSEYEYVEKGFIFPQKCHMPWTHANLLVNGDVSTCCTSGQPLGNLLEESFAEIWSGARYQEVRRLIHTNNPPLACKHCNLGAGIAAGNPSFFSKFLKDNTIESLALDDPLIRFTHPPKSDGGGIWVEGKTEVEVQTGGAEFIALKVDAAPGVNGRAVIGGSTQEFNLEDSTVLISLPNPSDGRLLRLCLETSGPVRLHGFDLLSYEHKAVDIVGASRKFQLDKFQGNLMLIHDRLAAALEHNTQLQTVMVFGANSVGWAVCRIAESFGLKVVGFLDNYITWFEKGTVHDPSELCRLKPDVVLIASKAHADTLTAQVVSFAEPATVVISARE